MLYDINCGKKELNTKMYAQLKTFMEEEKIINILDCENYIHEDAFPTFQLFSLKRYWGKEIAVLFRRKVILLGSEY